VGFLASKIYFFTMKDMKSLKLKDTKERFYHEEHEALEENTPPLTGFYHNHIHLCVSVLFCGQLLYFHHEGHEAHEGNFQNELCLINLSLTN
jgi:hypothetical protein